MIKRLLLESSGQIIKEESTVPDTDIAGQIRSLMESQNKAILISKKNIGRCEKALAQMEDIMKALLEVKKHYTIRDISYEFDESDFCLMIYGTHNLEEEEDRACLQDLLENKYNGYPGHRSVMSTIVSISLYF